MRNEDDTELFENERKKLVENLQKLCGVVERNEFDPIVY